MQKGDPSGVDLCLWSLNASTYHRPLVTYFSSMINIINPKVNTVVQNSLLKCGTYILLLRNTKILTKTSLGCITFLQLNKKWKWRWHCCQRKVQFYFLSDGRSISLCYRWTYWPFGHSHENDQFYVGTILRCPTFPVHIPRANFYQGLPTLIFTILYVMVVWSDNKTAQFAHCAKMTDMDMSIHSTSQIYYHLKAKDDCFLFICPSLASCFKFWYHESLEHVEDLWFPDW